jgi:hypothetical protein
MPEKNETEKSGHTYDPNNDCHKLIREALVLYNSELIRQGIDQRPLSIAMKNIWRDLNQTGGKFNLTCKQQQMAVAFAVKAQRKKAGHFDRILVHEIADRFPPRDDKVSHRLIEKEYVYGMVPRTVIQGYLSGIRDMFGTEKIDSLQERLDEIVFRHEEGQTGVIDWNGLYADPMTIGIRNEIFIKVKENFDENEKLRKWFVDRIEGSEKFSKVMERALDKREFDDILKGMLSSVKILTAETAEP